MSICIIKGERNDWVFLSDLLFQNENFKCSKCEYILDTAYCYIILELEKAKLLPKDFQPLCCTCYKIKKTVEQYICQFCKKVLDFEYINLNNQNRITYRSLGDQKTYRLKCNTKGCKFKKRIFIL